MTTDQAGDWTRLHHAGSWFRESYCADADPPPSRPHPRNGYSHGTTNTVTSHVSTANGNPSRRTSAGGARVRCQALPVGVRLRLHVAGSERVCEVVRESDDGVGLRYVG